MNVAAMVAALRRKLGVNANDGMLTPEVLRDLLNEANTMLEAERDWPWRLRQTTFSTVAGQAEYEAATFAPDADWLRTVELKPANEGPLGLRTYTDLDHENPASRQGAPSLYTFYGATLVLSPTPDGVTSIRHRYVRVSPALTADQDTPLMPAMFRWAIVQQAASLGFQHVGQDDRAQLAEAAVDRWRLRMIDDQRRATGSLRVRVRAGSAL